MNIFAKDKRLGSAEGKRRYDLPLTKDEGASALMLLIGLMTFLAAMTLAGSFTVGGMAARWSSGLENKITVEIAAEDVEGKIRSQKDMEELQEKAAKKLRADKDVAKVEILSRDDVRKLIEPWLGENVKLDDVPLPALISVETKNSDIDINALREQLKELDSAIEIDMHENWLGDLLRLTQTLHLAAVILAMIIAGTTASALAGAIKARMAVYRADVELLHLMGASDTYIMRQFQRHAIILTLKGGVLGLIAAVITLVLLGLMAGDIKENLIPALTLGFHKTLFILLLPLMAAGIGALTARFTVIRTLAKMP